MRGRLAAPDRCAEEGEPSDGSCGAAHREPNAGTAPSDPTSRDQPCNSAYDAKEDNCCQGVGNHSRRGRGQRTIRSKLGETEQEPHECELYEPGDPNDYGCPPGRRGA